MTTATQWKIAGNYLEACNCEIACPCIFLSSPTEGDCTVLVGWHIDRGSFGDVSLDGLNVAIAVHSPGNMAQVQWKAALYLDEKASEQQQNALTQIFGGQAGGHFGRVAQHIGEVVGVKTAAIEYKAEGKRRSLSISGVANTEMEAIEGQNGGEVKISGNPLAIVPGEPVIVARASQLNYHDHDMNWQITDRNGYYSPFTYEGP